MAVVHAVIYLDGLVPGFCWRRLLPNPNKEDKALVALLRGGLGG